MTPFAEALADLHDCCDSEFGVELEFNGNKVTGIVSPIDLSQPFESGGYIVTPSTEVSLSRADYYEFRHPPGESTISKDRVKVAGQEMRVLNSVDDPLCPWVRLRCDTVDN